MPSAVSIIDCARCGGHVALCVVQCARPSWRPRTAKAALVAFMCRTVPCVMCSTVATLHAALMRPTAPQSGTRKCDLACSAVTSSTSVRPRVAILTCGASPVGIHLAARTSAPSHRGGVQGARDLTKMERLAVWWRCTEGDPRRPSSGARTAARFSRLCGRRVTLRIMAGSASRLWRGIALQWPSLVWSRT